MGYSFYNLSATEFELLCKDIAEILFSQKMYCFAPGRDGGVDVADKEEQHEIIVQAKHYCNSTYANLRTTLYGEKAKLDAMKVKPKQYYLFTSIRLTDANRSEILGIFFEYMQDYTNIIDGVQLSSFLEQKEYSDILRKHNKLWLCSTSLLDILQSGSMYLDCDSLLFDVRRDARLFAQTDAYLQAKKVLEKEGVVIITGAPGVGKSMISGMLTLQYAAQGYYVRYTSDHDMSEIKKAVFSSADKKEIILLDDFLGQHYLNLYCHASELKTLISYVRRHKNKRLVLNSRITILNEAQARDDFRRLFEDSSTAKILLDVSRFSNYEKAKILCNHLDFCKMEKAYYSQIKNNRFYSRIIRHPNYNPRIIEYVTDRRHYQEIPPEKFCDYILEHLERPSAIWANEFQYRMQKEDRLLMYTLYSLGNTGVSIDVLQKAFEKQLEAQTDIDTSLNVFDNVMQRLNESVVRLQTDRKGNRFVRVINPSVNDYLEEYLLGNTLQITSLIQHAVYFEQLYRFSKNEQAHGAIRAQLLADALHTLDSFEDAKEEYFLSCLFALKMTDADKTQVHDTVNAFFEKTTNNLYLYDNVAFKLFVGDSIDAYCLDDIILSPKFFYMYSFLSVDTQHDIAMLFAMQYKEDSPLFDSMRPVIASELSESIEDDCYEHLDEYASDAVEHAFYFGNYDLTEEEFDSGEYPFDTEDITDAARESTSELLKEDVTRLTQLLGDDYGISLEDFDCDAIAASADYDEILESVLERHFINDTATPAQMENEQIDALFQ